MPLSPNGADGAHLMSLPLRDAREVFERQYLLAQIERFGGNISKTAEFVGMERSAAPEDQALGVIPTSGSAMRKRESAILPLSAAFKGKSIGSGPVRDRL